MSLRAIVSGSGEILGKKNVNVLLQLLTSSTRKLAYYAHALQMNFNWVVPPQPEWFDHFHDQFYLFRKSQSSVAMERGVYSLLCMKQDAEVLELCCGDGYNTFHFYSTRAKSIIAIDYDAEVISHAKKYNQSKNIVFSICDIRTEIPIGKFNNVVWDASIGYFPEQEISIILANIKARLTDNGILSGSTLLARTDGKSFSYTKYDFESKKDLCRFFEPHFKNVKIFETIYPTRHNLYFFASNGILPFDDDWDGQVIYKK